MLEKIDLKIISLIILILGISTYSFSQDLPKSEADYTRIQRSQHHRLNTQTIDVINSNRPGFSVSPYNIGKNNFQVETGIIGYNELLGINGINGSIKTLGLDIGLRYAINNNIEIYSDFYTKQNWNYIENDTTSNFSILPISLGASYRFNEGEKFIPTMSVRGAITYYKNDQNNYKTDLSFTFATQNELAVNWVLITNLKAERIITEASLGGIIGITNTITPNLSWFTEYFVTYYDNEFNNFLNVGMAYLYTDDIQFDLFGGTNLDINKTTYYLSAGVSWRLDNDKNRRKYNSPNGSEKVDHNIYTKYKNKGVR